MEEIHSIFALVQVNAETLWNQQCRKIIIPKFLLASSFSLA